jgi:hypothetical protein
VLAAFCWTKSLLCNVTAFTGMLLYPESPLQLCSSRRFCEVFKDLFRFPVSRPDDVVFRPDAHQSATSVRTTWLYRPDAIQCLTRIRVSASRHSYGKTATTVRTMCDPVRTMSSIRQEHGYQVQPSGRQPSWFERSSLIYGNRVHQFNRPDVSLQGPDAPTLIMVISCS